MTFSIRIIFVVAVSILYQSSSCNGFGSSEITFIKALHSINEGKGSWVSSPASVKSVIGQLYLGANGETKNELKSSLSITNEDQLSKQQAALSGPPGNGVVCDMANRILVKKSFPLNPDYTSKAKSIFHSEIENSDFNKPEETAKSINTWVSAKTNGLIKELISPRDLDLSMKMVILNAVYFNGVWKYSFKEELTEEKCFYSQPGQCDKIPMMTQSHQFKYGVHKELGATIAQLPYNDEKYSMVIVLPDNADGLTDVVKKLDTSNLSDYIAKMKFEHVELSMPKFTSNYKANLNEPLKKMGLSSIFNPSADFSAMTSAKGLYVSDVFHEAQISVSEKGTVAAAATGLVFGRTLITDEPEYIEMTVDHPFLYFILFQNTEILFVGQYIN